MDGTRIGVTPDTNTVVFRQSANSCDQVFNAKEALPEYVREKLLLVPKAVQHLVLPAPDVPQSKYAMLR